MKLSHRRTPVVPVVVGMLIGLALALAGQFVDAGDAGLAATEDGAAWAMLFMAVPAGAVAGVVHLSLFSLDAKGIFGRYVRWVVSFSIGPGLVGAAEAIRIGSMAPIIEMSYVGIVAGLGVATAHRFARSG